MIALIDQHRDDIARLCREHGITRLSVFGSALNETWRAGESDVDLLIDLDYGPGVGRRFMRFASALEQLLDHRVDIVTERSVTSDWFRQELKDTAVPLYSPDTERALG